MVNGQKVNLLKWRAIKLKRLQLKLRVYYFFPSRNIIWRATIGGGNAPPSCNSQLKRRSGQMLQLSFQVHNSHVQFETALPCRNVGTTQVYSVHSVLHASVLMEVPEFMHSIENIQLLRKQVRLQNKE